MPDEQGNILPPIPESAFDGVKESTDVKFTICPHKDVYLKTPRDLVCRSCGAGWTGIGIDKLLAKLKKT